MSGCKAPNRSVQSLAQQCLAGTQGPDVLPSSAGVGKDPLAASAAVPGVMGSKAGAARACVCNGSSRGLNSHPLPPRTRSRSVAPRVLPQIDQGLTRGNTPTTPSLNTPHPIQNSKLAAHRPGERGAHAHLMISIPRGTPPGGPALAWPQPGGASRRRRGAGLLCSRK